VGREGYPGYGCGPAVWIRFTFGEGRRESPAAVCRARVAVCHIGFVNGLGSDETVERCALLYPAWCIVWTASYMMTSSYLF
jgi:hypothetical protein